jgi:hypothetical protein
MPGERRTRRSGLLSRLVGSATAKDRLWWVVQTLAGLRSVDEASAGLGISPRRFHYLRTQLMQQAVEMLEPRPPGRPAQARESTRSNEAALTAELQQLKLDLQAARIREEIALAMPHLLNRSRRKKKGRRRQARQAHRSNDTLPPMSDGSAPSPSSPEDRQANAAVPPRNGEDGRQKG